MRGMLLNGDRGLGSCGRGKSACKTGEKVEWRGDKDEDKVSSGTKWRKLV